MGQYYKFANIDKKEKCDRNRSGYKLMEHSYVGNGYCDDILRLLSNEWKGDRVIHVGDYAEPGDGTTTDKFISKVVNDFGINYALYDYIDSFEEVDSSCKDNIRYVYNLSKKEYVDLLKQPIQDFGFDSKKNEIFPFKINSFALLIGCGNEQGGGDYRCINKKAVGCWAGDKLVSSVNPIEEYKKYKFKDLLFNEYKDKYKKMKKYYNFFESKILKEEESIFKDFVNYLDKSNIDITKLKINKDDLTESEIKIFSKILEAEQNKKKEKEVDKQL